jgi:NAD-dependent SIR2 family protein deacetylase
MTDLLEIAAKLLTNHKQLIITAGAGMSVASGLPDYRSNEGLYKHYPPFQKLGVCFEECANPNFFKAHPKMAWYFYGHRYLLYKNAEPHDGYSILKKIQEKYYEDKYFIYTSNVDGHFLKPQLGFDEQRVFEIHGSINYTQCDCLGVKYADYLDDFLKLNEEVGEVEEVPICDRCQQMVRPNVLMFDDWDFKDYRHAKQFDNYRLFKDTLNDVAIIEIGAGTHLPSIRMFGNNLVNSYKKCTLIRVNKYEAHFDKPKYGGGPMFNVKVIDKNTENPELSTSLNHVICIEMSAKEALTQIGKLIL